MLKSKSDLITKDLKNIITKITITGEISNPNLKFKGMHLLIGPRIGSDTL
jgi:hypothetical protein